MYSQNAILFFCIVVVLTVKTIHGLAPIYLKDTELHSRGIDDDKNLPSTSNNSNTKDNSKSLLNNENAKSALNHSTNEILRIIEDQYGMLTITTIMKKLKKTLTNNASKKSIQNFRTEIAYYLVQKETPQSIRDRFKNRIIHFTNEKTPQKIKENYKKMKEIVSNKNILDAIEGAGQEIRDFVINPNAKLEIKKARDLVNWIIHMEPGIIHRALSLV